MAKAWIGWALVAGCVSGLGGTGCVMGQQCACTDDFRSFTIVIRDANGPVDSAQVHVFKIADGKELARDTTHWPGAAKGQVIVFSDNNLKDIPAGSKTLEVRVVAAKDGKTGEARMTLGTQDCRCHVEKTAGKDTLLIQ